MTTFWRYRWIRRGAFFAFLAVMAIIAWPLPDPYVDLEAEFLRVMQEGHCAAVPPLVMLAADGASGQASKAVDRVKQARNPCREIFGPGLPVLDSDKPRDVKLEAANLSVQLTLARIHDYSVSIDRNMMEMHGVSFNYAVSEGAFTPVTLPGVRGDRWSFAALNPLFVIRCRIVPGERGISRYHLRRGFAAVLGAHDTQGHPFVIDAWERRFSACGVEAITLDDPMLEPRSGFGTVNDEP